MKKIYLLITLGIVMSLCAIAQSESDLKPFKVDVSGGYARTTGPDANSGGLFVVEPKYAVLSQLALGLRMEVAIVAKFSGYDSNGDPQDFDVKGSGGYLATADYYFSDNYPFRPFVGAGGGIFTLASIESNSSSDEISTGTKFGGMVRIGLEASHFRFGVEYNLVPKTTFKVYDSNGNLTSGLKSENSYIGIKLGICIGGGPRN